MSEYKYNVYENFEMGYPTKIGSFDDINEAVEFAKSKKNYDSVISVEVEYE